MKNYFVCSKGWFQWERTAKLQCVKPLLCKGRKSKLLFVSLLCVLQEGFYVVTDNKPATSALNYLISVFWSRKKQHMSWLLAVRDTTARGILIICNPSLTEGYAFPYTWRRVKYTRKILLMMTPKIHKKFSRSFKLNFPSFWYNLAKSYTGWIIILESSTNSKNSSSSIQKCLNRAIGIPRGDHTPGNRFADKGRTE